MSTRMSKDRGNGSNALSNILSKGLSQFIEDGSRTTGAVTSSSWVKQMEEVLVGPALELGGRMCPHTIALPPPQRGRPSPASSR